MGKKAACGLYPMPWWRKDQYKLQMAYPKIDKDPSQACNPIGRSTFFWGSNKEYPIKGEDFAQQLFAQQKVTVLPGSYLAREADGINPGEHYVRLALVAPLAECIQAAERIKAFVQSL